MECTLKQKVILIGIAGVGTIWFVIWLISFSLYIGYAPEEPQQTLCNVTNPTLDLTTYPGFANLSYYLENSNLSISTFKPGDYSTLIIPWTAAYNAMVNSSLQVNCFYIGGQLVDLYEQIIPIPNKFRALMIASLILWLISLVLISSGLFYLKYRNRVEYQSF